MTTAPCVVYDTYGYAFACDEPFVDPCMTASNTRLYALVPCLAGDEPIEHWCVRFPTHKMCIGMPTPATPATATTAPTTTMPKAGGDIPMAGGWLLLAGIALLAAARRPKPSRCRAG